MVGRLPLLALGLVALPGLSLAASCSSSNQIKPPAPSFGTWVNDPKPPTSFYRRQEDNTVDRQAVQSEDPAGKETRDEKKCPWNDRMPGTTKKSWTWTSGTVNLPEKSSVTVRACDWDGKSFATITIPSTSELIVLDQAMSVTIKAIKAYGRFRMGAEGCRLENKINIELIPQKAGGGIVGRAKSGQIDMHGHQYLPTWSRLSVTADPQTSHIYLQDRVDWEAGQKIVVITSIWKDNVDNQNEERTIKAIATNGKGMRIYLDAPLKFSHYGGEEYQSEVVLLSRRIRVFSKSSSTKIGSHMRCEGPGTQCRWSGLNLDGLGQRNLLGFYPAHFHMMGPSPKSYFQDNSCTNVNFRCIVVHGTDETLVQRNTMFNVDGHALYLEDGVEERNKIQYNFAGYVHTIGDPAKGSSQGGQQFKQGEGNGKAVQPADHSASPFYFSNANNYIVGNAASGGWSGFAFPLLPKPIGESSNVDMKPEERPLGSFVGNTAHSAGHEWEGAGSCIYSGGELKLSGGKLTYNSGRNDRDTVEIVKDCKPDGKGGQNCRDVRKPLWMEMVNNKVWMCNYGANTWGKRMTVKKWESHDCVRTVQLFGESSLEQAWVQGRSKNPQAHDTNIFSDTVTGFRFYDVSVKSILTHVTFTDFQMGGKSAVILGLTHSDIFKPNWISTTSDITYKRCDTRILHRRELRESGSEWQFNWFDTDGTASLSSKGQCAPTIVGSDISWWKTDDAKFNDDWKTWLIPANKPSRMVAGIDFRDLPGQCTNSGCLDIRGKSPDFKWTDSQRAQLAFGNVYKFGHADRTIRLTKHVWTSGIAGDNEGWFFDFKNGPPNNFIVLPSQISPDTFVVTAFRFQKCYDFTIDIKTWSKKQVMTLKKASSKQALVEGDGSTYYCGQEGGAYFLYLKLVNMAMGLEDGYFYASDKTAFVPEAQGGSYGNWKQAYYIKANGMGGQWKSSGKVVVPSAFNAKTKYCTSGWDSSPAGRFKNDWRKKQPDANIAKYLPYLWSGCVPKWECTLPGKPYANCAEKDMVCDDGDADTDFDICVAKGGPCKGKASTGPKVIQDSTSGWYIAAIISPSNDVSAVTVEDMWGVKLTLKHTGTETWTGKPTSKMQGDFTFKVTASKNGKTKTYTTLIEDWSKVKKTPITMTLPGGRNKYWFQVNPTPTDYLDSATATTYKADGKTVDKTITLTKSKWSTFGCSSNCGTYFIGDVDVTFTRKGGLPPVKLTAKNWASAEQSDTSISQGLGAGNASAGAGARLGGSRVQVGVACVALVAAIAVAAVLAKRRRSATSVTEVLLDAESEE